MPKDVVFSFLFLSTMHVRLSLVYTGPAQQAKQATSKAASGAQQPASDLGQQLSNVFGGVKLPWQQGNGVSKQQQVADVWRCKALRDVCNACIR